MSTSADLLFVLLQPFAEAFTQPVFAHVGLLVRGALLTTGRRTVTAALRAVGLQHDRHFTTYHRVLNRDVWPPLHLSRILLQCIVTTWLAPDAALVFLIDGTQERRWGRHILYKGRYHDAVRSQPGHTLTAEGIHWLCLMVLVPLPWSTKPWALPILTVPTRTPSLSAKLGKPHRTVPAYAEILVTLLRRWYPERELVLVGDSSFAAASLGNACRTLGVRLVSRFLLSAQLYNPVPPQPVNADIKMGLGQMRCYVMSAEMVQYEGRQPISTSCQFREFPRASCFLLLERLSPLGHLPSGHGNRLSAAGQLGTVIHPPNRAVS